MRRYILSDMASGHTALEFTDPVTYEAFETLAAELVDELGITIIDRIDSADVRLWKVQFKNEPMKLVFDEATGTASLESDTENGDWELKHLRLELSHRQRFSLPALDNRNRITIGIASLSLACVLLFAIYGTNANFLPTTAYGLVCLGLAIPAGLALMHFVLIPFAKPLTSLLPSGKSMRDGLDDNKRTRYWFFDLVLKLLTFKPTYYFLSCYVIFTILIFSLPEQLHGSIGSAFTEQATLDDKKTNFRRSWGCTYQVSVEGLESVFSIENRLCISREEYRQLKEYRPVTIKGYRNWMGTLVTSITPVTALPVNQQPLP